MLVCVYEDRPTALVGVKLLLLSLARFCPDVPVRLMCPSVPPDFRTWLGRVPQVQFSESAAIRTGWNVKPSLLLELLREGHPEVVWCDSDVILTGPFPSALTTAAPDVLVTTEDSYWGEQQAGYARTRAWGLAPGRRLSATANTSIVRVTGHHVEVLERWHELLGDPEYAQAQKQNWRDRPVHLMGDQDVLTALLASADFADVPVEMLRRDVDIAQCHGPAGYLPYQRIQAALRGGQLPPLVHGQGGRPWETRPAATSSKGRAQAYVEHVHQDTSPYTALARLYQDSLDEPTPWLTPRTAVGRALLSVFGGRVALQELPLAALHSASRHAARAMGRRG